MSGTPSENVSPSIRAALAVRFRGAVVLAAAVLALAVGWSMRPSPAGYGTHRQMGLPGCQWLARTGYPCPSCGLTTSVSAACRGRLATAAYAHPAGIVLALGLYAAAAAGLWEALTARGVLGRLAPRIHWYALALVAAVLAGWALVLLTGLANGRWPTH